jgi:hypothetical protein
VGEWKQAFGEHGEKARDESLSGYRVGRSGLVYLAMLMVTQDISIFITEITLL